GSSGTIGTGAPGAAPSLNSNEGEASSPDLQDQQIVIKTGDFQLDVPANSAALFPHGNTRGAITLTPLLKARTPVSLPFGFFNSDVVQITPFTVKIVLGAKLTFPNNDAIPANTKVDLFRYDQQDGTFAREIGAAQVSPDGRRIETNVGAIKLTSFYFVAMLRQTTTVTGRVFEKNGHPGSRALVSLRGQEASPDGTGTYISRPVPARADETISVEVSFIRALNRIERIQSQGVPAVINGITKIPDVILPDSHENRPPVILAPNKLDLDEGKILDTQVIVSDPDQGQRVNLSVSGASFASLIRGTGNNYTLRLAPNFQQSGELTLTLTATDSAEASTKQDIFVSVRNVNRPPEAASQSVTVDQNASVAIKL